MTILYISYDGMLEPLGQSQVLGYLKRLARDRRIILVSYEKSEDWANAAERRKVAEAVAAAGIDWRPLRYHKRPSGIATAYDIGRGILRALWLTRRHGVGVVHARSYVPAVIALALKRLTGVRFVFDMRGFWADERVDGGLWPRGGRMFRIAKWFERRFLLEADHVVSLTHAGVREMRRFPYLHGRMPPVSVIPTCADLDRFTLGVRSQGPRFTLGYVGSVGTWYLFDETVACFVQLLHLDPQAKLLVVNRGDHDYIRARLAAGGVPPEAVEIVAASHADVPGLIGRMHAGVFFIKPVFSKQASAPTKLAEFLGCGVPCLSNASVGDMAEVLRENRVGVALESFDAQAMAAGLRDLLALARDPTTAERCAATARRLFSLDEGVKAYGAIYASLEGPTTPRAAAATDAA